MLLTFSECRGASVLVLSPPSIWINILTDEMLFLPNNCITLGVLLPLGEEA
jgi:hypothetical protein